MAEVDVVGCADVVGAAEDEAGTEVVGSEVDTDESVDAIVDTDEIDSDVDEAVTDSVVVVVGVVGDGMDEDIDDSVREEPLKTENEQSRHKTDSTKQRRARTRLGAGRGDTRESFSVTAAPDLVSCIPAPAFPPEPPLQQWF
ncbi:hypothetical protein NEOLEDRAFT_17725 [Neolentinus lepideus HHB14362 ss-1]|uniref:Uncharacterized protein n=1 Tax=Neolentinus lepideus HHB14362 ss-1 TaxID=1314782 RepID=A0A165W252_9AGAM|nr:hypothetical protein NEOLEDRAFT_17725 [Neolentinus lepideus HHB14362 ss-1]